VVGPFRFQPARSSAALLSTAGVALLVGILLLQATEGPTALLSVGAPRTTAAAGGGLEVSVSLQSHRPWPIPVSAALLPLELQTQSRTVYVFEDPGYPALYGTTLEVDAFAQQLAHEFALLGSSTQVATVDAAGLPSFLSGNHSATLAVINYGAVPTSVLSNQSDSLGSWIHAGGQLLWAGGALGYFQGADPVGSSAVNPGSMGWSGELHLLGFPLVDPVSVGAKGPEAGAQDPLLGASPSPMAAALGLGYNATVFGANLTELAAHGGVDLGFDSSPLPSGAAGRSSIAYLPVGNGSLLLFGGAVLDPAGQYIPEGGVRLIQDSATLLAYPFVPLSGPIDVTSTTLGPFSEALLSLAIPGPTTSPTLLVRCALGGALMVERIQMIGP
jgi:hypothetical protein